VIHFPAGRRGAPATSDDGRHWTAIPRLATASLPAGQPDGYVEQADGSIDVYTSRADYFALLGPAAPIQLTATLRDGTLTLRWRPGPNGSSGRYLVVLNGGEATETTQTEVDLNTRRPSFTAHHPDRIQVAALGAGREAVGAQTITLIPTVRPESAPHDPPAWVWPLLARQLHHSTSGAAELPLPVQLPSWWTAWLNWQRHRFTVQTG
jgi:hypothetical protein